MNQFFHYLSSTHFTKPDSPTLSVPDFYPALPLCSASIPSTIPHAPQQTPSPISTPSPILSQNSDSVSITPSIIFPSSPLSLPDASPTIPDVSLNHHPMITRAKHGIFKPKILTANASSKKDVDASSKKDELCIVIPQSAKIALAIPVWKCAMTEEFLALLRNKTWTLAFLPPGKNLIGSTWVFRLKKNADGSIARHKARLVAQGFSQEAGFDFLETFSPVVKPTTIRLMLTIAITSGWSIKHLDVNNAFLHGELKEEIYMRQPPGFEQGPPGMVCKLNKAIYGLKQASRSWFLTMQSTLKDLGFSQSKADHSLFFLNTKSDTIYLLLYVDDMLLTGSSPYGVQRVVDQLNQKFSLKDLGEVKHFLGIEVSKTTQGLHLSQAGYISELLKKVKMTEAKPFPTPMVSDSKLSKVEGEPTVDGKLYRSVVGALQYVCNQTGAEFFC